METAFLLTYLILSIRSRPLSRSLIFVFIGHELFTHLYTYTHEIDDTIVSRKYWNIEGHES